MGYCVFGRVLEGGNFFMNVNYNYFMDFVWGNLIWMMGVWDEYLIGRECEL